MAYVIAAKSTYGDTLRIVAATPDKTVATAIVAELNLYVGERNVDAIKLWDAGFRGFTRAGLEYYMRARN